MRKPRKLKHDFSPPGFTKGKPCFFMPSKRNPVNLKGTSVSIPRSFLILTKKHGIVNAEKGEIS